MNDLVKYIDITWKLNGKPKHAKIHMKNIEGVLCDGLGCG